MHGSVVVSGKWVANVNRIRGSGAFLGLLGEGQDGEITLVRVSEMTGLEE